MPNNCAFRYCFQYFILQNHAQQYLPLGHTSVYTHEDGDTTYIQSNAALYKVGCTTKIQEKAKVRLEPS